MYNICIAYGSESSKLLLVVWSLGALTQMQHTLVQKPRIKVQINR